VSSATASAAFEHRPVGCAPKDRPAGRPYKPWIGYAGFFWALSYIPIHVYWALGGLTPAIGLTTSDHDARMANWGASVVILGAGLTSLALVQRWGTVLPAVLLRGTAWVGAVFGLLHFLAFSAASALRLVGVVGYPHDAELTPQEMDTYDIANLLYFELWFGIMGLLLIAGLRQDQRRHDPSAAPGVPSLPAWVPRARWTRLLSIAVLGAVAAVHQAWAFGVDWLITARPNDAVPRLIDLAETGSYRPVASAIGGLLLTLALAVVSGRKTAWRRGGTGLTLAGILTVVWGVFIFDAWTFAGYGPALTGSGLLTLVAYSASAQEVRAS
jgi:hypothetical protein